MLVGGMVAIGTKKMSAKNAQAIEEPASLQRSWKTLTSRRPCRN